MFNWLITKVVPLDFKYVKRFFLKSPFNIDIYNQCEQLFAPVINLVTIRDNTHLNIMNLVGCWFNSQCTYDVISKYFLFNHCDCQETIVS